MGWLSDLGKSAVGALTSGLISGGLGQVSNAMNVERQIKADKELFEYMNSNKFQYTVNDLRKAGLNPMLAVNGGLGAVSGSVGSVQGNNIDVSGINNATAQKAQIRIAEKNAETQRLKAISEIQENEANARHFDELVKELQFMRPFNSANQIADFTLKNAQVQDIFNQFSLAKQRLAIDKDLSNAQKAHLRAMAFHANILANKEIVNIQAMDKALYGTSATYRENWLNSTIGKFTTYFSYLANDIFAPISGAGVRIGNFSVGGHR